tara:strand:+ start:983 stop:1927 length:945 start_codon:yes stop_codon:yes gene_type:complete
MPITFNKLFDIQKEFNDIFFDLESLSQRQREEITKSLCLELHAEVTELVTGINFKNHRIERKDPDIHKILYESVDVIRYVISILNLWEISPEQFIDAFLDKDLFLQNRRRINSSVWEGQPVVIVDLDDVVIKFRDGFLSWLDKRYDIKVSPESKEYYTSTEVKAVGLNPETVFFNFISDRGLRSLDAEPDMIDTINDLKSRGYWIQLLTARPEENLVCLYDTYRWLEGSGLKYDRLNFSGEKYRWCAQSEYFDKEKIVCAIDDSAKHASEYAKHGIPVFLPKKSYNIEVQNSENVITFENTEEISIKIGNLLNN